MLRICKIYNELTIKAGTEAPTFTTLQQYGNKELHLIVRGGGSDVGAAAGSFVTPLSSNLHLVLLSSLSAVPQAANPSATTGRNLIRTWVILQSITGLGIPNHYHSHISGQSLDIWLLFHMFDT